MNPFEQKPEKKMDEMVMDWSTMSPKPYGKLEADPYTKTRIILMNGIEVEAVMFGHNFNRNCEDNDLRRDLYLEIGMVEEEHVTHYGALLDPSATWLQNLLLREYMETYLYYSFYETEVDPYV